MVKKEKKTIVTRFKEKNYCELIENALLVKKNEIENRRQAGTDSLELT